MMAARYLSCSTQLLSETASPCLSLKNVISYSFFANTSSGLLAGHDTENGNFGMEYVRFQNGMENNTPYRRIYLKNFTE